VCVDVDECAVSNCTNCCTNTIGSFICERGYFAFNDSECRRTYSLQFTSSCDSALYLWQTLLPSVTREAVQNDVNGALAVALTLTGSSTRACVTRGISVARCQFMDLLYSVYSPSVAAGCLPIFSEPSPVRSMHVSWLETKLETKLQRCRLWQPTTQHRNRWKCGSTRGQVYIPSVTVLQ